MQPPTPASKRESTLTWSSSGYGQFSLPLATKASFSDRDGSRTASSGWLKMRSTSPTQGFNVQRMEEFVRSATTGVTMSWD